MVKKLLKIWSWDPGSVKNLSRIQGSKRHRSRIPDPDPQHCIKVLIIETPPIDYWLTQLVFFSAFIFLLLVRGKVFLGINRDVQYILMKRFRSLSSVYTTLLSLYPPLLSVFCFASALHLLLVTAIPFTLLSLNLHFLWYILVHFPIFLLSLFLWLFFLIFCISFCPEVLLLVCFSFLWILYISLMRTIVTNKGGQSANKFRKSQICGLNFFRFTDILQM